MILNLTSNINNFTKSENMMLDGFLSRIQLKGMLDGIIIEMMNGREGLVETEAGRIRVSLPEGVNKGDKVAIKTERQGDRLVLEVSGRDNAATAKVIEKDAARITKEEVYQIKIPQKVNIKQVLSNIEKEVAGLKKSELPLRETAGKIEDFIESERVRINDGTKTAELSTEIKKYVKKSGVFFEDRLKDVIETKSPEKQALNLEEIKDDIKYKINSILEQLHTAGNALEADIHRADSLDKLISQIAGMGKTLTGQKDAGANELKDIIVSFQHVMDAIQIFTAHSTEADSAALGRIIDFAIKFVDFAEQAGALTTDVIAGLAKLGEEIQAALSKAAPQQPEAETSHASRELPLTESLLPELVALKAALETASKGVVRHHTPEADFPQEQPGDTAVHTGALKKALQSLNAELTKIKAEIQADSAQGKTTELKTISNLIRDFGRLAESVDYQHLASQKGPDGNVSYIALPVMFDDKLETSEIVISHRKSKKGTKKGRHESRIEIFLNLTASGYIKVDFNVSGRDLTGDFFSADDDTVNLIDENMNTLKESLGEKDFNVVRINSRKARRPGKCEIKPEDNLIMEEIRIFDFKV